MIINGTDSYFLNLLHLAGILIGTFTTLSVIKLFKLKLKKQTKRYKIKNV